MDKTRITKANKQHARRSAGAGVLRKGNRMKYIVKIWITETMSFVFDCIGDAMDFAITCVENGYRATIIPMESEEE